MKDVADYQQQCVKFVCGVFFYGVLSALVGQVVITGIRLNNEVGFQRELILTNQMRWDTMCTDAMRVFELKFQDECRTYNEMRHQSPYTLAVGEMAKAYAFCDPTNGGCRGAAGMVVGALLASIAVLYLLRHAPDMIARRTHEREVQDLQQFVYNRAR